MKLLSFHSVEYLLTSCDSTYILLDVLYTIILFGNYSLQEYGLYALLLYSCDIVAVNRCGSVGLRGGIAAKLILIVALK